MAIDRSQEEMVTRCWAWMLVIGFSPVLIPLAVLSIPYFAYKGVKAVSKKCTTIPPEQK